RLPLSRWATGDGRLSDVGLAGLLRGGSDRNPALVREVFSDFLFPVLIRAVGVEFEFEAIGHLRGHGLHVDVELLIPPAQLIDGTVFFGQQRVVDAGLVLPYLDILQEADLDTLGRASGDFLGKLRRVTRLFLDDHSKLQDETRWRDWVMAVDQHRLTVGPPVRAVQPV